MRKIWMSLLLGLLLVIALAAAVFSQTSPGVQPAVQILQGGVDQQIPLDVTVLVPSESGVQTVTIPLVLNLNLTVGPVEAIDLDVSVEQALPFESPITVLTSITETQPTTTTTP